MKMLCTFIASVVLSSAVILGADSIHSNSGYVRSIHKVSHGKYTHTVIDFEITSSAEPVPMVIWLYNDEARLKAGDHVRIEWSLYGTDEGVKQVDQCMATKPETEPCVLQEIVAIKPLKPGEY
jgi:hypothetical protein